VVFFLELVAFLLVTLIVVFLFFGLSISSDRNPSATSAISVIENTDVLCCSNWYIAYIPASRKKYEL